MAAMGMYVGHQTGPDLLWVGRRVTRKWPLETKPEPMLPTESPVDPEKIQAPFFLKSDTSYLCFYNGRGIRLMTSQDGVNYDRHLLKDNITMYCMKKVDGT
ncbi:MAG: hypothetical protein ACOCXH_05880 [Cyclobacteriaceae bacterium]